MTFIELMARLDRRREELGMSKKDLAARARIPIATLNRVLSGHEKRPAFDLVIALVRALELVIQAGPGITLLEPETPFAVRKKQAKKKAERAVRMVQGTMGLEAQALGPNDLEAMVEQTTCELMAGSGRKLWSA